MQAMQLTVVNVSNQIRAHELTSAIDAIQKQVDQHFEPEWKQGAKLHGKTRKLGNQDAPIDSAHDAIIYVGDKTQDPTDGIGIVLGYHERNHGKIPYGFVFLDVCALYGRPWAMTLSHEVLELLADPNAQRTFEGPDPDRKNHLVRYYVEVCDPVQGDSYLIDGIRVSNFVTHAYYRQPGSTPKTNHLGLELDPFKAREQGSVPYVEADGGQFEVLGATPPEILARRSEARKLMMLGRRVARRALQIGSSLVKGA